MSAHPRLPQRLDLSSRLLLEEGRQHDADDIRKQLAALHLGQRRHAVDDWGGSAKDEALHLGRVHRASQRLEPGRLQQLVHTGGDDAVKLAGVGCHALLQSVGRLLQQGPVPFAGFDHPFLGPISKAEK